MRTIEGTIRLTTPMHVADTGKYRIDDAGRITKGDLGDGKPLNRLVRMPLVPIRPPRATEAASDTPGVCEIPYFPSNDLRGRLRRQAREILLDRLAEMRQTVSLDTYHGMSCGAVSGTPSKGGITCSEAQAARSHVFMGLFGGGPRVLRSGLRTHDLIPVMPCTIASGMVPARYREQANAASGLRELTYVIHQIRVDDLLLFDDPRAGQVITDYRNAIELWHDQITQECDLANAIKAQAMKARARRRKNEGETLNKPRRARLTSMTAIEAVAPGTVFYFRVGFADYCTDAQIGLALEALVRLVNEQALGGLANKGFGCYAADLVLYHNGRPQAAVLHYQQDSMRYELSSASPIRPYRQACADALAKVDAADLERFFTGKKEGKDGFAAAYGSAAA